MLQRLQVIRDACIRKPYLFHYRRGALALLFESEKDSGSRDESCFDISSRGQVGFGVECGCGSFGHVITSYELCERRLFLLLLAFTKHGIDLIVKQYQALFMVLS